MTTLLFLLFPIVYTTSAANTTASQYANHDLDSDTEDDEEDAVDPLVMAVFHFELCALINYFRNHPQDFEDHAKILRVINRIRWKKAENKISICRRTELFHDLLKFQSIMECITHDEFDAWFDAWKVNHIEADRLVEQYVYVEEDHVGNVIEWPGSKRLQLSNTGKVIRIGDWSRHNTNARPLTYLDEDEEEDVTGKCRHTWPTGHHPAASQRYQLVAFHFPCLWFSNPPTHIQEDVGGRWVPMDQACHLRGEDQTHNRAEDLLRTTASANLTGGKAVSRFNALSESDSDESESDESESD